MGVFTLKPGRKKARAVACGSYTAKGSVADAYSGQVDITAIRAALRVSALQGWSVLSVDVSTAFLNAELPEDQPIAVRPPAVWVQAGLVEKGSLRHLQRALYGLREAPKAWADHRDGRMREMKVEVNGVKQYLLQCKSDPGV